MKPMRLVLALPLALALAGCSILGSEQRDPITIFAPDVRVPARPDWPAVSWTLVIAKPTAARVIDEIREHFHNLTFQAGNLEFHCSLSAGVASTDHDDVKLLGIDHGFPRRGWQQKGRNFSRSPALSKGLDRSAILIDLKRIDRLDLV